MEANAWLRQKALEEIDGIDAGIDHGLIATAILAGAVSREEIVKALDEVESKILVTIDLELDK